MPKDQYLKQLDAIIAEAKSSADPEVRHSVVVLLGLQGALLAGDDLFTAFVDEVAGLVQRQLTIALTLRKQQG